MNNKSELLAKCIALYAGGMRSKDDQTSTLQCGWYTQQLTDMSLGIVQLRTLSRVLMCVHH